MGKKKGVVANATTPESACQIHGVAVLEFADGGKCFVRWEGNADASDFKSVSTTAARGFADEIWGQTSFQKLR